MQSSLAFGASLAVVTLLIPSTAHAYMDPGTGMLIIHTIVGALVGGLIMVKLFWRNLKEKFFPGSECESDGGTLPQPSRDKTHGSTD